MMNEKFRKLGFYPADILLPKGIDLTKWAVVACDQFTSQPEYWETVERTVGDAPSTLRMILPEAKLNSPDVDRHIAEIHAVMERYLAADLFETLHQTLIYVERTQSNGKIRHGLVGMVDLEQYEFTSGSGTLIRATEGTVLSRIPPRVRVRQNAPLELPHVMLLIDDPEESVMKPLRGGREMQLLYDFPLQQDGGQIRGWRLTDVQADAVADALLTLCDPEQITRKYGIQDVPPLLFAVGDGNHSLATAKQCYENLKRRTPEAQRADLPIRYALVEVVNNHDEALEFEPIHRVLFDVDPERFMEEFRKAFPNAYEGTGVGHTIEFVWEGNDVLITIPDPKAQLAVGTLQTFLDLYTGTYGGRVDYIHGDRVTHELGVKPGRMGFLLPPLRKDQLFRTVIADGVLPRKTFSMGAARDKRYYLEVRRIRSEIQSGRT